MDPKIKLSAAIKALQHIAEAYNDHAEPNLYGSMFVMSESYYPPVLDPTVTDDARVIVTANGVWVNAKQVEPSPTQRDQPKS